jgi:hypothetical protein
MDSYQCDKCSCYINNTADFGSHMLLQHQIRLEVFKCNFCQYMSFQRELTIKHMKNAHKVNSAIFQCPRCDYRTTVKRTIKEHMKGHHSPSLKENKQLRVSEKYTL